jgi:ribosome-binding factor A
VAKIYVSFLAAKRPAPDCIKQLADHVPELRRELSKRLRIRVLPEIRFAYDDSIERGMRMDALLDRLAHEAPASGETADSQDGSGQP